MSKEMFVSLTPHETKVAVNEDDLLAEVYFERENEYTLAGSIYKGRVTRVLPGMQSAFVDIGLERDAFLYVSDFLELEDEEEQVDPVAVQPQQQREQRSSEAYFSNGQSAPTVFESPEGFDEEQQRHPEPTPEASAPEPQQQRPAENRDREGRGGGWRGRRGRRGRRGSFGDDRSARGEEQPREREPRHDRGGDFGPPPGYQPIILPGESISKYRNASPSSFTPGPIDLDAETSAASDNRNIGVSPVTQHSAAETETPVIEAPSFQQEYVETPLNEEERSEDRAPDVQEAQSHGTRFQSYREPEPPAPVEEKQRFDQMNVATIFGGEEATRAEVPSEQSKPAVEEPITSEDPSAPESHQTHATVIDENNFGIHRAEPETETHHASHRTFEEEEITEEETDLPNPHEHVDDASEFEELEEETLEPMAAHHDDSAAEMITEAVEETDEEQAIEEEEFEENGEEAAEGEEDVEGEFEEEGTRAELRGPSGTAGYQQRAQRPAPGFDRRRGRRGGRRMRQRVSTQRQQIQISDILKEGQEVLIQIAKEPIGKKGARITSHIALPGRFMVYMPTVSHIGVSRKIASDEERQRLKRIVGAEREAGHGGFIVRTAAERVSEEELKQDIRFLKGLWSEIKTRADSAKSPALIYHDLNLVERLLRDLLSDDFTHVWVDNEAEYERILRFVNRFQPNMVRRIRLYTKETPLFEQFGIQDEINKALKSKVWLKSGGYIVINQTEALVAIDVNTGKYVGKTTRLEDTIVKTNVDAIKEIVRQIRLRDLGGIIVIDFIDMDERKNRQKVMQALEEALQADRAPSKVLQFNDFGLVAITRKRVKHSLERVLGQPCPTCTGTGLVKSVETVCNEVFVEMKKMRRHIEGREIMLRVHPDVAKQLKSNNAKWLNDLEELTGKTIIIKSDASLHPEQFDM